MGQIPTFRNLNNLETTTLHKHTTETQLNSQPIYMSLDNVSNENLNSPYYRVSQMPPQNLQSPMRVQQPVQFVQNPRVPIFNQVPLQQMPSNQFSGNPFMRGD